MEALLSEEQVFATFILMIDLKMSGQHFALLVQNGGIFLSDLNSTNGTFVDGKPVEAGPEVTVPVANGSTIEAGSVTFVIRW